MKNNKTEITVKDGFTGDELTMSFAPDASMKQWVHVFTCILTHATFMDDQIRAIFSEDYL